MSADRHKGQQSGFLVIAGKELRRFFTDRRLVMTTVVMPGLMIFAIYSLMGGAVGNMLAVDADYRPTAYAVNLPQSMANEDQQLGVDFKALDSAGIQSVQSGIADKQVDLLVVFPEDFDSLVARQLAGEAGVAPPVVEIYFNSTRNESANLFMVMTAFLDSYKSNLAPLFMVNLGPGTYDLATSEDTTGFVFASMLPMLIMVFLFSGCVSVAPESIAGEKERGTIATMLVTPLARYELALGKIIALAAIALLSGLSSFLGVMLSLPRLFGSLSAEATTILYGPGDYAMLLGVIISTVLLFIGLIAVFSAFAKTVKEASTYIVPLMIVVMMVSVSGMFAQGAATDLALYLIPVYNSVQCMTGIFSFSLDPVTVAITVAVNIALTGGCVALLTWMFGSERIVFAK